MTLTEARSKSENEGEQGGSPNPYPRHASCCRFAPARVAPQVGVGDLGRSADKIMNRLFTVFVVIATSLSAFADPERNLGLSLHMLPERVANISGEKGGFTVSSPAPKTKYPL